jgi:hypothetical protein
MVFADAVNTDRKFFREGYADPNMKLLAFERKEYE